MDRDAVPTADNKDATSPRGRVRQRMAFLRRLPFFADLPDRDLLRVCRGANHLVIRPGDTLIQEGSECDGLYVIVSGEMEVTRLENGYPVVLGLRGPGEVLGEMSLLERVPRTATVRARQSSEVLRIDPDEFRALLAQSTAASETIIRTLTARLRSTEALVMQQEKLAALGTLAAGLAHELNNPAAAIRRSADQLEASLGERQRWTARLGALGLSAERWSRLEAAASEPAPAATPAGALAAARAEERLTGWLDDAGADGSWRIAPSLAAHGWDADRLAALAQGLDTDAIPALAAWLAAELEVRSLLAEIASSARAIGDVVGAVKTYAYLDRAPVQEVEIHEGLEDTLRMLRHKLKHGVTVERDYASDLPRVEAYGGELNQVWTNLIDNAVDAMDGAGRITLRTRAGGDHVIVEVTDSGPGIPDDVRSRIFEPFFTTKQVGSGSGLGLHIVHTIVVGKHGGRIAVDSRPGCTKFEVVLPRRLPRPGEEPDR